MKRGRIDKKKESEKIRLKKKTKNLITNKRAKEREPDPWKEVYSKFKLLSKKYKNFREKQKIKKQKEEQRKLKEQEEQRLQEQEEQKLQEQEERKLQKEQKLKEEEEIRLKARQEQRLEEKKIKEEQQEREKQDRIHKENIKKEQQEQERQEHIYKERLVKGDRERLKQLEKAHQLRQEEKRLKEERELLIREKKLKKEIRLEEKRLDGKVKWFNGAKGYGFIERKDEEKDVFVHFSAVKKSGLKSLKEGEQLTFEIKNSDKGPSAINLQKVMNLQKAPALRLVKKN